MPVPRLSAFSGRSISSRGTTREQDCVLHRLSSLYFSRWRRILEYLRARASARDNHMDRRGESGVRAVIFGNVPVVLARFHALQANSVSQLGSQHYTVANDCTSRIRNPAESLKNPEAPSRPKQNVVSCFSMLTRSGLPVLFSEESRLRQSCQQTSRGEAADARESLLEEESALFAPGYILLWRVRVSYVLCPLL